MNTVSMDFGTYNSAVAYRQPDGGVTLLRPRFGNRGIIPSFMRFTQQGEIECFGDAAKNIVDPQHIVWGLKRLLGLSYKDAFEREELERFKFKTMDAGGKLLIEIGNHLYTPIDLVTLFLKKVKETCESTESNLPFSGSLEKLIITHPAYFDTGQTSSLKESAVKAGYAAVEMITEPEAAAIAYKDLIDFKSEPLVMVIDWGAGTLDFFLAHFFEENNRPKIAQATPAFGDTRLGGMDMDDALLKAVRDVYRLGDLDESDEARLRIEVEKAKIELSDSEFTVRFFAVKDRGISLNFVRSQHLIPTGEDKSQWIALEQILNDENYGNILGKFKKNLLYTLHKHNFKASDVESLILVGGPIHIPAVREAISEIFADNQLVQEELKRLGGGFPVSPFEAVARGAILREDVDVGAILTPHTYGFMLDGKLLQSLTIPRGTPIARGLQKIVREIPSSLSARAGMHLGLSLYMKKETAGGVEHWQLGDYRFAPVAESGRGTDVQPVIEISAEGGICTLKMRDLVSKNELSLEYKDDSSKQIGEPEYLQILDTKDIPKEAMEEFKRSRQEGEFPAKEVDATLLEAKICQRGIQQALNEGGQLPEEIKRLHGRLSDLIPTVALGKAIEASSNEAKCYQQLLNELNKLKKELANINFKF